MENASKALVIAGGIMIAMLIVGSLVLLFSNLSDYQNKADISAKQSQIAEFNNQFEPYNEDDITLMELKSVYNKIISNNRRFPEYHIANNIEATYVDITKDFKEILEEDKMNKVFKCTKIEYKNLDGRISKMEFADVTP